MNTEELYIWRYGIDKLPKGLLEYGKSDVCDTYDESIHIPEHTRSLSGSLLGYKTIP